MKTRPVGAELFHADGQTDRHDEANSGFSQCCERAQKYVNKLTTMYLYNAVCRNSCHNNVFVQCAGTAVTTMYLYNAVCRNSCHNNVFVQCSVQEQLSQQCICTVQCAGTAVTKPQGRLIIRRLQVPTDLLTSQ